jgi:hypothetical protein
MKRFEELTREELAALTNEQRQAYIDYACAEQGIPFLPPMPEDPKNRKPEKDATIFSLNIGYFLKQADAQAVMDFIQKNGFQLVDMHYLSGPSYETMYEKRTTDDISISTSRVYSPETANKYRSVIEQAEKDRKKYDEDLANYKHIYDQRRDVISEIDEKISQACDFLEKRRFYTETFNRYLEVAGGVHNVAMYFFKNAYGAKCPTEILDELTVTSSGN